MQGGARSNEVIIQAVAFPKILGFNDLVVVLTMFRKIFNNLLRFLLELLGIFWMFLFFWNVSDFFGFF